MYILTDGDGLKEVLSTVNVLRLSNYFLFVFMFACYNNVGIFRSNHHFFLCIRNLVVVCNRKSQNTFVECNRKNWFVFHVYV